MNRSCIKDILNTEIISIISLDDLSLLMTQLSLLISSNVSIIRALDIVEESSKKSLGSMINRIKEKVARGMSLGQAFNEENFHSSELVSAMVSAGEMTGNLGKTLDLMAEYFKNKSINRKEIRSSLIYPIILLIVSLLVIILTMVFVMPTYVKLFESRQVDLPLVTRIFLNISDFVSNNLLAILLTSFLIILFVIILYKKNRKFRYLIDKASVKIPILKSNQYNFLYSYSAISISILNSCKIPMLDIVNIIKKASSNLFFKEKFESIYKSIEKGEEIYKAFEKESIFSSLYISMLRTGEESGKLDKIMMKTSDYYNDKLRNSLKQMSKIFEPVIILIMALIVGFIVFSIALPMFNLVSTV